MYLDRSPSRPCCTATAFRVHPLHPAQNPSTIGRRLDSWASEVKNQASGFFTMPNHITPRTICRLERVLVSNVLWLARPPRFERTSRPIEVNGVLDRGVSRQFVCTLNDRTNASTTLLEAPERRFTPSTVNDKPESQLSGAAAFLGLWKISAAEPN